MTLGLLLATLVAGSPLQPELYAGQHRPPVAVVPVPVPVRPHRGGHIYGGVRNVVSGSILTALGTGFGVLGIYGLIGAANEPAGSTKTVYTALGWTSAGVGMLLGAVGIPLLIVGIVQLSMGPGVASRLTISDQGLLAVRF